MSFTLLLSNGYKNERVEVSDIFVPFPDCSRIAKAQMYEMVACFRLQGLYRYFFFNYILNIIRIFRTLTPDIGKIFGDKVLAYVCCCLLNSSLHYERDVFLKSNITLCDERVFFQLFSRGVFNIIFPCFYWVIKSFGALQKVAENNVAFFFFLVKTKRHTELFIVHIHLPSISYHLSS